MRVVLCLLLLATLGAGGCSHPQVQGTAAAAPLPPLTADERAATLAAAAQLVLVATEAVPVCVELQDAVTRYALDSAFLAPLGPRARTRNDCPRTYASMIRNPDAPQRPAGYIDPYQLVLWRPAPVDGATRVVAQLWQGTRFSAYQCEVFRTSTAWKAACRRTGSGVS